MFWITFKSGQIIPQSGANRLWVAAFTISGTAFVGNDRRHHAVVLSKVPPTIDHRISACDKFKTLWWLKKIAENGG